MQAGRSSGARLCLAQWAAWIPGEDWHSLTISGKSHSPPGRSPKLTWHPKTSASQWEARTGGPRAEAGVQPGRAPRAASWLAGLPARSIYGSGCFPSCRRIPPRGRRQREGEKQRGKRDSSLWGLDEEGTEILCDFPLESTLTVSCGVWGSQQ